MLNLETIAELRAACDGARARNLRVGVVPTMGFLHEGHRSLMRAARAECDFVVVTIFVNPLQFGANEDLDRYPRDLAGDLAQCEAEGIDCVFSPSVAEMYPQAPVTAVHVAGLSEELCGAARPTHFDGVTTVVTKLFAIVGPCNAYFGRKDAQQLAVVRRMVDDLNLPVTVVGCPIVREADGIAMSSRNAYLAPSERIAARALSRALRHAVDAIEAGERSAANLTDAITRELEREPLVELDYAEARDAHELTRVTALDGPVLLALAARIGGTRLIDNAVVHVDGKTVVADLGVVSATVDGSRAVLQPGSL